MALFNGIIMPPTVQGVHVQLLNPHDWRILHTILHIVRSKIYKRKRATYAKNIDGKFTFQKKIFTKWEVRICQDLFAHIFLFNLFIIADGLEPKLLGDLQLKHFTVFN